MTTTLSSSHPAAPPAIAIADRGVLRGALGLTVLSLAVFGFLYSLAGVGIGQLLFPAQAQGSVIQRGGAVVGSALVAQPFVGEGYFQPRPSAAGYQPMALSGSNQARTHPELRQRIEAARAAVARREGVDPAEVPADLITQSGSGIDPHISVPGAAIQVNRVARARGLSRAEVQRLLAAHTEAPPPGLPGAPRVHVLSLNLALDALPRARDQ